jgi:DNA-binding MarR family transcriptional regulator
LVHWACLVLVVLKVLELILQIKASDYSISNPEERYLNILQNKPYLLQRFSQYHIASYIGVRPESLSRMKKRMSKII